MGDGVLISVKTRERELVEDEIEEEHPERMSLAASKVSRLESVVVEVEERR